MFVKANIGVDQKWQQNLWELSADNKVDFLCFLQSKIIRDLRKAVDDYQSVSCNTFTILQYFCLCITKLLLV